MCIIKSSDHLSSKQQKYKKKKTKKKQKKKTRDPDKFKGFNLLRETDKKKWQTNVEQFLSGHPRGGFSENSNEIDSIIVKSPWQP